ncbi:hypothetical protein NR798_02965 [Archangium gephyra]|uniref:hypothetical protein n=1 Tax=Archangium gephyra TaxID=48 RepID=UPI0035D4F0A4
MTQPLLHPAQAIKNKISELTHAVQQLPPSVRKEFSRLPKEAELRFNSIAQYGISAAAATRPAAPGMVTVRHGPIEIRVKPLDLGVTGHALSAAMDTAMEEKAADDERAYGAKTRENGFASLVEWATKQGYYNSVEHQAWAKGAEARTGGRVPASWWIKFDPFGGTAGNGPDVLPQGRWPGALARIAIGHDTDWSLGRYFNVGPMKVLYRAVADPFILGIVGLVPMPLTQFGSAGIYTNPSGHIDWQVFVR